LFSWYSPCYIEFSQKGVPFDEWHFKEEKRAERESTQKN